MIRPHRRSHNLMSLSKLHTAPAVRVYLDFHNADPTARGDVSESALLDAIKADPDRPGGVEIKLPKLETKLPKLAVRARVQLRVCFYSLRGPSGK